MQSRPWSLRYPCCGPKGSQLSSGNEIGGRNATVACFVFVCFIVVVFPDNFIQNVWDFSSILKMGAFGSTLCFFYKNV